MSELAPFPPSYQDKACPMCEKPEMRPLYREAACVDENDPPPPGVEPEKPHGDHAHLHWGCRACGYIKATRAAQG